MKKYTIILSDDEDNNIYTKDSFVHTSPNLSKDQEAPLTKVKLSSTSQMYNISQEISNASQSKQFDALDRIKNESNGSVRNPILKSDDEILFWVTTSRPPCLYRMYDERLNRDLSKPEKTQELGYRQLLSNCVPSTGTQSNTEYNQKISLDKTCPSTDPSTESEPIVLPLTSFKDVHCIDSNKNKNVVSLQKDTMTAMDQPHFVNVSPNKLDSKCSIEEAPSGFNIRDKPFESKLNLGGKMCSILSNVNGENHTIFKQKDLRSPIPLNDYDSDSSVLTVNYIQYVNKAKVNTRSKSFSVKRHNDLVYPRIQYSSNNLKPKVIRSKMSLLKNRTLDMSGMMGQHKSRSPVKYDNNSSDIVGCQPQDETEGYKALSKKKQLCKLSYADMKHKNKKIFDTSKRSSSSIENSFGNKYQQFKKCSQKVLSSADNTMHYQLRKVPNKASCSDYGSSTSSCNVNVLKSSKNQNIMMSYTKVETCVVSASGHNSNNTYSTVINFSKQSTSFLSDSL